MSYYYYKQYDDNNFRFIVSKRKLKDIKNEREIDFENIKTEKNEVNRISQSRVKRVIRELLVCNDFDYFCTWTVDSLHCDRYSLSDCQRKMILALRNLSKKQLRKGLPKCEYLFVTEKHKDGAFHFHGCIKNMLVDNYINKNGYLSNKIFDSIGNQSFSKIKNKTACANYIMKYITKDSIQNENGHYYFRSYGLKNPSKLCEIMPIDFNIFISNNGQIMYYDNEFVKVCDVQLDRVPRHVITYLKYNCDDKKGFFETLLNNYISGNSSHSTNE